MSQRHKKKKKKRKIFFHQYGGYSRRRRRIRLFRLIRDASCALQTYKGSVFHSDLHDASQVNAAAAIIHQTCVLFLVGMGPWILSILFVKPFALGFDTTW